MDKRINTKATPLYAKLRTFMCSTTFSSLCFFVFYPFPIEIELFYMDQIGLLLPGQSSSSNSIFNAVYGLIFQNKADIVHRLQLHSCRGHKKWLVMLFKLLSVVNTPVFI